MTDFDELLRLQDHDTTADQIRHRIATLPERAELERLAAHLDALSSSTAEVQARRDDLAREQKRLQDEADLVEAKAVEVNGTLYSGGVTSHRELQSLQQEIDALKRQQSRLEDRVIELMEEAEPVDAELARLEAGRTTALDEQAAARATLAIAEEDLHAELAVVEGERDEIVSLLPLDLVATYEKLRHDYQGIAVARLVGNNCGGCHLTLSAVELDRIRHSPPDALVHCDECGRLLVH